MNHKRFDIVFFLHAIRTLRCNKIQKHFNVFFLSLDMNKWLLELFLLNFNKFFTLNGDLWLTFIRLISIQNRIKQ